MDVLSQQEKEAFAKAVEDEKLVDTLFAEARAKQIVSVYSIPVHRCEFERYIYRDGQRFKTNHYKYFIIANGEINTPRRIKYLLEKIQRETKIPLENLAFERKEELFEKKS